MSSKTKLKVLFFAKARELLKISESEIIVPSVIDSAQALYQALEDKWPELAKLNRTFALALNEEYLSQDQEPGEHLSLSSGDILAVIPPISGG